MSFCFSDQVVDSDRPEGSKFRLTGKGVDQEPKGIFRINENTGSVSVTRTLDREMIATYQVSSPRVPTLHADMWLFQDYCLPTELVISVLHQTQGCAALSVSLWEPSGVEPQQGNSGGLFLINRACRPL